MVYCFSGFQNIDERKTNLLYNFLPASIKRKADVRTGLTRTITIFEYFLFKRLLKFSGFPDFSYNENGKPALSGFNFSFSHAGDKLFIAVDCQPIGLDAQQISALDASLKQFLLTPKQIKIVNSSTEPEKEFAKIYAKREATIKCLGLNMTFINTVPSGKFCYSFFVKENFVVCLCKIGQE